MRKVILFSLFFFLASISFSQFVVFGVKGGLNLAKFTGNDIENAKFLPSFHIGGTANFLINENFMVQPEVIYSGKGSKGDNGSYKFGYINVPVLIQYKTPSGFFVEAGPQIGFLVNSKLKSAGGGSSDYKDFVKSTDYSWVGGLGYKSAMGIGASARYDFGFFNIANQGIIRNKTIMISLFYTFGSNQQE